MQEAGKARLLFTSGPELSKLTAALHAQFTPLTAYAFIAMSLIYVPCIATIAAIRREAGGRWALLATGYSLALGRVVAVAINQVGRLFLH